MNGSWTRGLMVAALLAGGFALGQISSAGGGALAAREPDAGRVEPQGRGAPPPPKPEPEPVPTESTSEPLIYGGDDTGSGSANGFIAVTGSYGVGTSVLYVLDTTSRQLAIYEARGGSPGSRRLVFVGARRIDLDLQLEGYNDDSEFSHRDLVRRFEQRAGNAPGTGPSGPPAAAGETAPGAPRK